jgi:hypothetical protein
MFFETGFKNLAMENKQFKIRYEYQNFPLPNAFTQIRHEIVAACESAIAIA